MTAEFGDLRLPSRFWAKVRRSRNGCWHWTGYVDRDGYGKYALVKNGARPAHRIVYEALVERLVPRGEPGHRQVDHECHNRSTSCTGGPSCLHRRCVNPAHLRAVVAAVNTARSRHSPATRNAAKTHCIHGHELTAENLYRGPGGRRWCKTCQIARRTAARRCAAAERGPVAPGRPRGTTCAHGHPLSGENLYVSPAGVRGCRTCRRRRSRENYLRRIS